MNSFSQTAKEGLLYYVYCLVNPSDGKIFYIGKGENDRVFDHAKGAIADAKESDKIDLIRKIINEDKKEVLHYIIRHGMDSDTAYEVESALIDLLTYPHFNLESVLTNIVTGHHQWDRGIKTVNEIEQTYAVETLKVNPGDFILCVNLNKSYKKRRDIYEITRGDWNVAQLWQPKITHVLGIYKDVVRGVYKPESWEFVRTKGNKKYWRFVGKELPDSPYMNKSTKDIVKFNPRSGRTYLR